MRRAQAGVLLGSAIVALPAAALAQPPSLPTGGAYVAGAGSIATAGPAMTITQSSKRAVLDWQGFSIGAGDQVRFNNGSGATLNRVTGASLSTIAGALSASGSVYLINPNGVVIGPGGKIVTGGSFVAATRDVANSQFMAGGSLTVSGSSNGTVTNEGRIVSQSGDVVLIGEAATNSGSIAAPKGTAALAAGGTVVLRAAGGPAGVYVVPDPKASGNVANSGWIKAASVALAAAGGNVYALAGNRQGLIEATGTRTIAGQVWLAAPNGTVSVAGTVRARNADGTGGTIAAYGSAVAIGGTARLLATGTRGGTVLVGVAAPGGANEAERTFIASGAVIRAGGTAPGSGGAIETSGRTLTLGAAQVSAGPGGSWVLDPTDITIDAAAAGTIESSLNSDTDVTEETSSGGTGNITVASPISWSSSATLTLSAFNSVIVGAAITATGNGSLAIVTNNNDGGTSSGGTLAFTGGDIQFTAAGEGALSINGTAYTLIQSMAELQDVASTGNYALAVDLDASGTSFTPIGESTAFTGTFNGLANTISNLTIHSSSDYLVGLFGQIGSGGVVENLGLLGGSMVGSDAAGVGLLAGGNSGGTIANDYATGTATGTGGTGGLVGYNDGGGTIADSYATGAVTSEDSIAGGLVGENIDSTIKDSYATGTVGGEGYLGGLIGLTNAGTITDAYWNEDRSGTTTGVGSGSDSGVTGLSGSAVFTASDYAGFTFTTTPGETGNAWVIVDSDGSLNNASGASGGTMPMLASEYATTIVNAHQLQLMAMDPTASYTLATDIDASATGSSISATTGTDVWGSGGFVPVGQGTAFTGAFNGLGNTISNLTIDSSAIFVGLFGQVGAGGIVENLGLVGGSVTGSTGADVGGLAGENAGGSTITNVYGTGTVSDSGTGSDDTFVGGLVGWNGGRIEDAYTTGAVSSSGSDDYADVGGLAGYNNGTIEDAYATGAISSSGAYDIGGLAGYDGGTIEDSYATGAVSDTGTGGAADVGGLVGHIYDGAVEDAYASGAVTGGDSAYVGGLVGMNEVGTIEDAYAIGAVTGGEDADVGGLVGLNLDTIENAYWDTTTSGTATGIGVNSGSGVPIGLTTAAWLTEGPIATGIWSTATWVAGYPYPVLKALPYVLVSATGTLTYGSSSPTIGITGITDQNGNDASSLVDTADVAWLSTASATGNVGAYVIGGTGATVSAGYQLTYIGTLTVDPASLTITADDETKTYGQTATLAGYSVSGLVNGDSVRSVALASSGAAATANVGSYAIVPGSATGSGLSNYAITYEGGTLTVDPAVLTAGLTGSVAKIYDGTTAATLIPANYTLSGVVGTDNVSLNDPASGAYATAAAGTGIPVTVNSLALLGPDAGDYVLADPSVTADIGVITPAPIVQPVLVALPSPLPLLPMLAPLPQPVPTSGAGALLLVGGNGAGPLPAIIAEDDAAGILISPEEIAFSTGLPLAASAEQVLIITGRNRHLGMTLPPAPFPVSLKGGF